MRFHRPSIRLFSCLFLCAMTFGCASSPSRLELPAPMVDAEATISEGPAVAKSVASEATEVETEPDRDIAASGEAETAADPVVRAYARQLGMHLDGSENLDLIAAVAEWLGTPYRWGGCSRSGIDCSCLVREIYKTVYGIRLKRTCLTMYRNNLRSIVPEALQEGDVVCFNTRGSRVSHIGIYLKDGKFVHASQSSGVRISSLHHPYYKKRFTVACRVISREPIGVAELRLGELVVIDK